MNKTLFRKIRFGFAATAALVLFCSAGVSQAGEMESESQKKDPKFTVGAGIAIVPDYEGSDYYEAAPLLHLRVAWGNGRYFNFTGNEAQFNVMKDSKFSFGPMMRIRAKRDDDVEDSQVSRMEEVDTSVELGGFIAYSLWENFEIGANLVQDIADGHDGYLVGLHVGYKVHKDKTMVALKAFTTYVNNDYMESYFSVNYWNIGSAQLPLYDADDSFKDVGLTCIINYQFTDKWGATGVLGYTRLVGDAGDSPVVDDRGDANQFMGGIMATYKF
jgi:outer membrane scaffolding protein for murein synthesis (MipA/OmpV family)